MANLWNRIKKKLFNIIARVYRVRINNEMRKKIRNKDFSILSANCTGGVISHDLGLQFNSPTINFFFMANDYLKFVENIDYYLKQDVIPYTDQYMQYPIACIGDLKCYLVHYKTVDQFRIAWERRKTRIKKDNIFLILTDRDGFLEDMLKRYAMLPYKKILFCHRIYKGYDFEVLIPDFAKNSFVGVMSDFATIYGEKYYDRYFDIVGWLNGKNIDECKKI